MKKIVMSIDPSLTGFAICILNEDAEVLYTSEKGTKAVKTLKGRLNRLRGLADNARKIAEDFKPDLILIEGYSYGSSGRAIISLAELGIMVRDRLSGTSTLVEVPPTTLKKFITGKGNASKVQIASTLAKKYDISFTSDNHADAYGLAQLGLAYFKPENILAYQKDAVKIVTDLVQGEVS
jgi:crossover junction endodeoxyribonuclease RuvC